MNLNEPSAATNGTIRAEALAFRQCVADLFVLIVVLVKHGTSCCPVKPVAAPEATKMFFFLIGVVPVLEIAMAAAVPLGDVEGPVGVATPP